MAMRGWVLAAAAAFVATGFVATLDVAEAQNRRGVSNNPNYSYMAGPRTRVYVTRRSWLDAGTEVTPGDRKFQDYVFPPGWNLADQNDPRGGFRRQPLPDPFDLPGYPKF